MSTQDKKALFLAYWLMLAPAGLPDPVSEYRFHKTRRFRFDVAWPDLWVAVEIDGGQWKAYGGRHARDSDRVKRNLAVLGGWRVLLYSTQQLERDPHSCIKETAQFLNEEVDPNDYIRPHPG